MIDITGLDKARVLMALVYGADMAQPSGLGLGLKRGFTYTQAQQLLAESTYVDYVQGLPIKVDLTENQFNPHLYALANGKGVAECVVIEEKLLQTYRDYPVQIKWPVLDQEPLFIRPISIDLGFGPWVVTQLGSRSYDRKSFLSPPPTEYAVYEQPT